MFDWLLGPSGDSVETYLNNFQAQQAPMERRDFGAAMGRSLEGDANLAGQQQMYLETLRAQAEGRGIPSLAQMQLQQALSRNQANAAGTMAANRGMNPALAARLVGQQSASMAQDAAGQGAMLRAQEQMAAQQALGQMLVATRGQEQNLYGTAGQLGHNQNALGVQNFQQTQGLNANIAQANQQSQAEAQRQRLGLEAKRAEALRAGIGAVFDAGAGIATGGVLNRRGGGGSSAPAMNAPVSAPAPVVVPYTPMNAAHGATVPGKPVLPGVDHPVNDTVDARLTPGEIVLPLSVTNAPDAPSRAAAFVQRELEKAQQERMLQQALARGGR